MLQPLEPDWNVAEKNSAIYRRGDLNVNNEFKDLKKELNTIFDSHLYTSRKQEILKCVSNDDKQPLFRGVKPMVHSLLTLGLLLGFAYYSYNYVFKDYTNGNDELRETIPIDEMKSRIEAQWAKPFEQFQTVQGSYTFIDHLKEQTENVTYAISKENNTIRILHTNNQTTNIIENQEIYSIYHDKKYYKKLNLVDPPASYLKKYRDTSILALYPMHLDNNLFSANYVWTKIEESSSYRGYNIYEIFAKRVNGTGEIDNFHFKIEKQTGFLVELRAYSLDGKALLEYTTQELNLNSTLTDEFFSPALEGYLDIENYVKNLPESQKHNE